MLFTAETNKHKLISNIFEPISNILEIGTLNINNDGISLLGMDTSHVSLLKLNLNRNEFSNFRNSNNNVNIGINFTDFVKILKTGCDSEKLVIDLENDEELNITFIDSGLNRKFTLKLLDTEKNNLNIPITDYQLDIDISPKLFNNILNSFLITETDALSFITKNNKLYIKSDSLNSKLEVCFNELQGTIKTKKIKINSKNETRIDESFDISYKLNKCNGEFESAFGTTLLKKISKANSLVSSIKFNLSPDIPIKIDYQLTEFSVLNFYLSPKFLDEC